MFLSQLAAFLTQHHHIHWVYQLFVASPKRVDQIILWAREHGFVYQP